MDGPTTLVFLAVVGARFLVPLAIPRWPLPAIVASLVLDAADQTVFQTFGYDPPGYQSYDKAMDVYYLAIAYLATLRNFSSLPAFRIGRFLYFYRLVGVVAFELSAARAAAADLPQHLRVLLHRLRGGPLPLVADQVRGALVAVGGRADLGRGQAPPGVLDPRRQARRHRPLSAHVWAGPLLVLLGVGAALVVRRRLVPRLPPPAWPWRLRADPLPEAIDTAREQQEWHIVHGRVWSLPTLEKVALVGMIAVVYGQSLPGVSATALQVFIGTGVVVALNAAITLALARRRWAVLESSLATFALRMALNVALVALAEAVLGLGTEDVDTISSLFFLGLISLITTLHDRWLPVYELRRRDERTAAAATASPA